jgi:glyoxylase-like metal-dependent hydrolase (beta-lactamase superfamily II)
LPERFEHDGFRFRVVPTPGHAFDHVCLFEEERGWLVSGDLYVHERVPVGRKIEDFGAHLDSIDRVLALEPELLVCAHAGVVEDARGALSRKAQFWRDLAGEVRERRLRGQTLRQITRELLGREGRLHYMSFGDFSKLNLVAALAELPELQDVTPPCPSSAPVGTAPSP